MQFIIYLFLYLWFLKFSCCFQCKLAFLLSFFFPGCLERILNQLFWISSKQPVLILFNENREWSNVMHYFVFHVIWYFGTFLARSLLSFQALQCLVLIKCHLCIHFDMIYFKEIDLLANWAAKIVCCIVHNL